MPSVHVSSESQFDKAKNGSALCVVDFTATWCGPCKAVAPRFEKLADQYPNVVFLKVDVDEMQSIARQHGVSAMPTFHLYRAGKRLDEVVGADIVKVERLVKQHSAGGLGSGFPATGGRVLGTGKTAPPSPEASAPQANYLLWGSITAVIAFLWWNKES